jgi:hypothetical protein
MKYHITIKDNETGEVKFEKDACVVIAGINDGEGTTGGRGLKRMRALSFLRSLAF